MISETAISDIEDLERDGVRLTPREVVRLNALGLVMERGERTASLYTLPRVAFLGGIVFREPAIGHELWLDEVARAFDMKDAMTGFFIRAMCLATMDPDALPPWHDASAVQTALETFVRGEIRTRTLAEVVNCVNYCQTGADASEGEFHASGEDAKIPDDFSPAAGVLMRGVARRIGLSITEAKTLTRSQMVALIRRMDIEDGQTKPDSSDAAGDYFAELDEIKAHHAKEATNG